MSNSQFKSVIKVVTIIELIIIGHGGTRLIIKMTLLLMLIIHEIVMHVMIWLHLLERRWYVILIDPIKEITTETVMVSYPVSKSHHFHGSVMCAVVIRYQVLLTEVTAAATGLHFTKIRVLREVMILAKLTVVNRLLLLMLLLMMYLMLFYNYFSLVLRSILWVRHSEFL